MTSHHLLKLSIALSAASILFAGCGGGGEEEAAAPSNFSFRLDVVAKDNHNNPVPNSPVILDGKTVGRTDKAGRFTASLEERPGVEIRLEVAAAEGFRPITQTSTSAKLQVKQNSKGSVVGDSVSLSVTFEDVRHQHLVWVHLECQEGMPEGACADIPIFHEDEVVATTDPFGRAHFLIEGAEGKDAHIYFDTKRPPADGSAPYTLDPVEPAFDLKFGRKPQIFKIHQVMTNSYVPPAGTRPTNTVRRPPTTSNKPAKITKPAQPVVKKKPVEKKPAAKQPIQLF